MKKKTSHPTQRSSTPASHVSQGNADIDAFIGALAKRPKRVSGGRRGRLVFALDATMSRQPSWDRACQIQGDMFLETEAVGGLAVQLVFFRGYRECKASGWKESGADLAAIMSGVQCRGGYTQIGRVLSHILKEHDKTSVDAAVFVGDAGEEEADHLCHLAGELSLRNIPLFLFQEGHNRLVQTAFQEMARLSGGAWAPFDSASPQQLRDLLRAVAIYAAGGAKALADHAKKSSAGVKLLQQMKGMDG